MSNQAPAPDSRIARDHAPIRVSPLLRNVADHGRCAARKIRLLVVDDKPVVHEGLRSFIEEHGERLEIIDSVRTGQEAIDAARRSGPDVVQLDAWLPDMLLAEAVRRIRAVSPASRIVVFTAPVTPTVLDEATELGVHGFLGKDADLRELVDVLIRVAGGEVVIADNVSKDILRLAAMRLHCAPLTGREYEILRRAAKGESNCEIAKAIYLAPTTVKSYLQSALSKLGARNRAGAVATLGRVGLL
jgi:two-component system nitrate/nitrite response regulator NarL